MGLAEVNGKKVERTESIVVVMMMGRKAVIVDHGGDGIVDGNGDRSKCGVKENTEWVQRVSG